MSNSNNDKEIYEVPNKFKTTTDLLNHIDNTQYAATKSGAAISQTPGRELKNDVTNHIFHLLADSGFTVHMTDVGPVLEMENKQHNYICVECNFKVKSLEYDVFEGIDAYEAKVDKEIEKAAKKAAREKQ